MRRAVVPRLAERVLGASIAVATVTAERSSHTLAGHGEGHSHFGTEHAVLADLVALAGR